MFCLSPLIPIMGWEENSLGRSKNKKDGSGHLTRTEISWKSASSLALSIQEVFWFSIVLTKYLRYICIYYLVIEVYFLNDWLLSVFFLRLPDFFLIVSIAFVVVAFYKAAFMWLNIFFFFKRFLLKYVGSFLRGWPAFREEAKWNS